ncbi:esterase-like activity of phytase family protein [Nonomuraea sp. NPDC050663]|uniref:caspase, EACC1-associated type n=1 Tax=Nonomuraea sp. NPDC050663 TaxID=3364370 RepID=UPI0037B38244
MTRLPDPGKSYAVLIGVDAYTKMEPLPAVARNLEKLKSVLTNRDILGIPEKQCHVVGNPASMKDLLDPVVRASELATDTLIVYYSGHGMLANTSLAFCLTLPDSETGRKHTAVPYDFLREVIADNHRARRRIIVLDCCYSGRAVQNMCPGPTLLDLASVEGAYVMTAAGKNAVAISPEGEECTAFTGALVQVMEQGVPGAGELLSLDEVLGSAYARLDAQRRPLPRWQDQGIGALPFIRNRALEGAQAPPPRPRGRDRRWIAAAVTAVATAAATTFFLWPQTSAEATGPCSERVTLLGYSDALDKARYQAGKTVSHLSALALTGKDRALALADNAPPRLLDLSLGADGLSPRVVGSWELTRRGGARYPGEPAGFDGEGLVVAAGSVLVASETLPSIQRFARDDHQALEALPVPERFLLGPEGSAVPDKTFESLAATTDGLSLFTGLEEPLGVDGSDRGRGRVRILRYRLQEGRYVPAEQYPYLTDGGHQLVELVALEPDRLLALERSWTDGAGNSVKLYLVDLRGKLDVRHQPSIKDLSPAAYAGKRLLADLAECPGASAPSRQPQRNALLDNIEGMALDHAEGVLYLISDDNGSDRQTTRLYKLKLDLT